MRKNISKKKNNLSVTRNREAKQFYVVPINDDEFSQSPSTLNVGCMYFVTYIPTDVTGQRLQGSAGQVRGVIYVGLCMAMYGYVGLCSAVQGYVCLCMAMQGYVGLYRAMYGYVWLCRAVQG